MFRRAIWNLFKVEYENYYHVYDFKSIGGIKLPYKIKKNEEIPIIIDKVF